ncbi:chalcone isomerase family protein [Halopseudomonas nanhaiensis]|uniref:chalcone isomerase family protein n=1 Tax=Halopseudomonas nanhaiensis TaxID=2830842 RepID=UPI001CC0A561|nr:chalcone isomerase family protein [Halopseudomonas nanhaiensis]UAW96985.1 chalcone isomerase family protein [Halopseudomonas nanhaiensis]
MRVSFLWVVLTLWTGHALAVDPRLIEASFPQYVQTEDVLLIKRQSGVLSYFFVDVYSAALFTPEGVSSSDLDIAAHPFRLDTYYHRDIDRDDAIDLFWKVLRRQHSSQELERLAPAVNALHEKIPDIRSGDRYSLTLRADTAIVLERNGEHLFSSDDDEFAHAYARLWLGEKGISRKLRRLLLSAE